MIRIAISPAAFEAIARTLPPCSVGCERERTVDGKAFLWLDPGAAAKLEALRGPRELFSEVILRIAATERGG
jgi:hypothetical protein